MTIDYAHLPTWHILAKRAVQCLARVAGWDGSLINKASVASIAYKVFDEDAANVETGSGSVTVATAVYDTAQTGDNWPYDDGYNFLFVVPGSCFPTNSHRYRVEFTVTPTSGAVYSLPPYLIFAQPLLSS